MSRREARKSRSTYPFTLIYQKYIQRNEYYAIASALQFFFFGPQFPLTSISFLSRSAHSHTPTTQMTLVQPSGEMSAKIREVGKLITFSSALKLIKPPMAPRDTVEKKSNSDDTTLYNSIHRSCASLTQMPSQRISPRFASGWRSNLICRKTWVSETRE